MVAPRAAAAGAGRGLALLALLALLAVPAAAVKQTKAYVPPEEERNFTVHYWTGVGRKGFVWPEQDPSGDWRMPALMAKPSLGVAVSGGGYRATTTGLGWLRALEKRGVLRRAKYLSSNSGGSWLTGALSYTQMPWPVFFGPGPAPDQMKWEGVHNGTWLPAGSYGSAIERGTIVGDAIGSVVVDTVLTPDSVAQVKGWSDTVGEAFLDPFGVGPHGSSVTALGAGLEVEEKTVAGADEGVVLVAGETATTATTAAAPAAPVAAPAPAATKAPTTPPTTAAGRRLLQQPAPTTPTTRPTSTTPTPSPYAGVAGPVAERVASQAPAIPFLSAAGLPDRPFPILVGSILAPNTSHPYRPAEFTPLYVATPGQDPPPVEGELGGGKDGKGKADPQAAAGGTYPPLGGMAIEPLGLNSYPPAANGTNTKPKSSPTGKATIEARSRFVTPLVTMVGVSSSFVAQGLRPESDAAEDITGTETLWYWAPSRDGKAFEGREWGFADGGGVDNTAIIPLLRRGVKRIIAGTSTSVAADDKTNATAWGAAQWDVAGLFGAVPRAAPAIKQGKVNGMLVADFNDFMQVFPTAGYAKLYKAIEGAVAQGKPATYRLKTQVLPNKWQGVEGGYDVDLLWFFNQPCADFEALLPKDTQDALGAARRDDKTDKQQQKAGGSPDLKTFPMISTFNADYSPALTTLLAGQSEWQANEALDQVDEMVAAAEAEAAEGGGGAGAVAASGAGGAGAAAPTAAAAKGSSSSSKGQQQPPAESASAAPKAGAVAAGASAGAAAPSAAKAAAAPAPAANTTKAG